MAALRPLPPLDRQSALSRDLSGRVPLPALTPAQLGTWQPANLLPFEENSVTGQRRPALPNALTAVIDALLTPGNALQAKYPPRITDGRVDPYSALIPPAMNMAGTIGVSGGAVPKLPNTLGMFGGVMARTADKAALETAQKMAEKGATKEEIWDATGWFKGADDKWRFEIDDSASRYRPPEQKRFEAADVGDVAFQNNATVLSHPALNQAYADIASIDTTVTKGGGYPYQPSGKFQQRESGKQEIFVDASNLASARSINLHELQHAIQTREGFGRGGSPSEYARGPMFSKEANDLKADLSRSIFGGIAAPPSEVISSIKYGDPAELARIAKKHGFDSIDSAVKFLAEQDEMRTPFSQYQRTSGEVEARNVETRRDLTPEQRRAKAPWLTQDVPYERQIVRK